MTPEQAQAHKARVVARRAQLLASPKYQAARALAASPAGRQLLAWMEAEFDGDDLAGDSVEETYFNLGARWLFRELRFLATAGERTGDRTDG
jgi:hypothetical protein